MKTINIDTTSGGSHTLRRARRAHYLHQALIAPGLLLVAFYGAWHYGPLVSFAMCVVVVGQAVYARKSKLGYEGRVVTLLSIAGAAVLAATDIAIIVYWLLLQR